MPRQSRAAAPGASPPPPQPPTTFLVGPLAAVSRFCHKQTTLIHFFAALTSASLLFFNILTEQEELQKSVGMLLLDPRSSYSPGEAYELLDTLGPEGRAGYSHINAMDFAVPFLMSSLLCMGTSFAFSEAGYGHEWNVFPFIYAIADWCKNIGVRVMLWRYPKQDVMVAAITGLLTSMKWRFLYYALALLAVGLGLAGVKYARRKLKRS